MIFEWGGGYLNLNIHLPIQFIIGILNLEIVNWLKCNFANCLVKVLKDEVQFALIIKDISMDDVKQVCYSGFTMPQKSTYFYPKVICGFLFSSIKEDEFKVPPYFSL